MSTIRWTEAAAARSASWHSESDTPAHGRVVTADDTMRADAAYRLTRTGTALLWRGTYPGARHLLQALGRRIDGDARRTARPAAATADGFHRYRRARAERARVLGRLLIPLDDGHVIPLRRAPDVRLACAEAYGPSCGPMVVALRELLGVVGAHRWRTAGVAVAALGGAHVHPHFGVFSPVRGEYVDLLTRAPLPRHGPRTAFDIGTGTGVLAAVLARRGIAHITATDAAPRALVCARANVERLGLAARVEVIGPALFPPGRADLIVCNPPWIPAQPATPFDRAVFDPEGAMLRAVLTGLPAHLEPRGEAWLVLSDLPEHLGLRTRTGLLSAIASAGLEIRGRLTTRPAHPRAHTTADPLHRARAAEITSLWRLAPRT